MSATTTGLIGWPVDHSLSPTIHGYWRALYKVPGEYKLFPINPDHMAAEIATLKRSGLRGFNVTVPHKETIQPHLDTIDVAAQHIGAVNTVIRDGSTWRGTNTDAYGFITHLKEAAGDLTPYLTRVIILGAGGAARAAIVALKEAGAKNITLINRTKATADALAAEFGLKSEAWENRNEALEGASLLVNTTLLGMKGKPPLEVDLKKFSKTGAVYDIVYAPLETEILKSARSLRLLAVDGLGMLLYQAQRAFEEWHGILPAVDQGVRNAVLAEIKKRENT